MVELHVIVRPSLGASLCFVWGAENKHAAPHSLLAAARLSPRLHVFVKSMLLVAAARVAKGPRNSVLQAAHNWSCLLQ
jgi:hypothetical protein